MCFEKQVDIHVSAQNRDNRLCATIPSQASAETHTFGGRAEPLPALTQPPACLRACPSLSPEHLSLGMPDLVQLPNLAYVAMETERALCPILVSTKRGVS